MWIDDKIGAILCFTFIPTSFPCVQPALWWQLAVGQALGDASLVQLLINTLVL